MSCCCCSFVPRCLPERAVSIFDESDPEAQMEFIKQLCVRIDKAVTRSTEVDCPMTLPSIVSEVHFWRTPLVRWLVDQFKAANFNVEDVQLRSRVWPLFTGVNSTFHVDEKVFGYLATQTGKTNASGTISNSTAHYHASTCPFLEDCGVQILSVPDASYSLDRPLNQRESAAIYHRPRHHKPKVDLKPLMDTNAAAHGVKYQRVGIQSYRSQLSAVDYILLDADNNFSNADDAWRSKMFLDKLVLHKAGSNEYYQSLGPSSYTFLAVQLRTWMQGTVRYFTAHGSRHSGTYINLLWAVMWHAFL